MRFELTMICTAAMALTPAGCSPEPASGINDEVVAYEVDDDSMQTSLPEDTSSTGLGGTVLNADGSPIAGAFIQVECIGKPCPAIPDLGVLSNESGHFRWPLPQGRFRVVARFENDVSTPVEVRVLDAGTPPIELTLDSSTR